MLQIICEKCGKDITCPNCCVKLPPIDGKPGEPAGISCPYCKGLGRIPHDCTPYFMM